MKMSSIIIFLIITFCTFINSFGQERLTEFYRLIKQNDTSKIEKHLEKWKSEKPEEVDLYIANFNFYLFKSREINMKVIDNPKDYPRAQILNLDSISDEIKPIYGIQKIEFNRKILDKGFAQINEGILKKPNRLDMRIGKVYVFNQIKDFESSKKEIIILINHSAKIENNWLWSNNEKLDNPKETMFQLIQNYIIELVQSPINKNYEIIEQISKEILKNYPNHIRSLTNLSNVYNSQKKYDESLKMLIKAHNIDSKDLVVIGNIANSYESKNDFPNAIKYYKLMNKKGTKDAKEFAKIKIKELKKK